MKYKVWLIAIILLAVSLVIVACGMTEQEVEQAQQAQEEAAAAPAGPVLVNFYTWAESDYEQWALEQMVAKFEEKNPDIEVTLEIER